jgi:hypothetical protein
MWLKNGFDKCVKWCQHDTIKVLQWVSLVYIETTHTSQITLPCDMAYTHDT